MKLESTRQGCEHVTTCNGMHTDDLPSADPWWFHGRLRWKRNRKGSEPHADSRLFGRLPITGRGKVLAAYSQGQSSPTGRTRGSDKSPDFVLWVAQGAGVSPPRLRLAESAQLPRGVSEPDEPPHCCCVCQGAAEDIITTVGVLRWAPLLSVMWIW